MSDAGLKVIIAEDNLVQRTYLMQLVQQLGYDAVPAADGEEALLRLEETGAQILITDFKMPKLDGLELTRRVRERASDQYVHIVVLTGNGEDRLRTEALHAGADDFLAKGSNIANLKARIHTATRLIEHASELAARTKVLQESNQRIQDDLNAAAEAQRKLLPELHDTFSGFRISSAFKPSSFVSGDMFGCFKVTDDVLGIYAVDVSGHGVHAALLSVAIGHLVTPEFFRTRVMQDNDKFDVAALVHSLNDRFASTDDDQYFSMFCAAIDRRKADVTFCQAGYPSPYYVDPQGSIHSIGQGGFPVGMFPEVEFENDVFAFEDGGTLVICSDAASEAEDPNQIQYGSIRLEQLIQHGVGLADQPLPDGLVAKLNDWRCGVPLEDDLTVVSLERSRSDDPHNQT